MLDISEYAAAADLVVGDVIESGSHRCHQQSMAPPSMTDDKVMPACDRSSSELWGFEQRDPLPMSDRTKRTDA